MCLAQGPQRSDDSGFLFVCHKFTDIRRDLIHSVPDICQPYLNVLPFGGISLIFNQKKADFKSSTGIYN